MPAVVGLVVPDAKRVAYEAGVVIASADPDGPPIGALTWPGVWVVIAQRPAPGTVIRRWGSVVVDVRQGPPGEAGVREPRRPPPHAGTLSVEQDPADDAGPAR
ncbi:PASTA domain-containing protein [Spirillospora sp. NBC_00431]